MRRLALLISLIGASLVCPAGCGGSAPDGGYSSIALIQSQREVADRDLLVEVARDFYRTYPDQYDMLVLWGGPEFAPGHSFYWPVRNDVPGIGYENQGPEFFDTAADFGSKRLQGIIWMGPDWITNTDATMGPRSVIGILAQETGHRWAATVHFRDLTLNTDSAALLEDAFHWNFYLNTGASPMGGNQWDSLGFGLYQALPLDRVLYCDLDLYLMGLMRAEEARPVELLVNARSQDASSDSAPSKVSSKVSEPVTVKAEVVEISIEQVIDAEGRRDPDVGFNARDIRQAWIYVYQTPNQPYYPGLKNLETLQAGWDDFFSQATGGRSNMNASLY